MGSGQTVVKNTGILLLGRLLIIVLGINYVAALSRYIHAEGMGWIATATSLVSIASLVVNFGLGNLAVRDVAADKSRAAAYFTNLSFLRGGLSLVFVVIVLAVSKWVNYPAEIFTVICIYASAYIFDEFSEICVSIFNAHEKMGYSAALQTGRDLLNIGLSLAAIALKTSLCIIVGISALANLVKLIASLKVLTAKFARPAPRVDLQLSRQLFVLALPFAALTFINNASGQIDTFLLSLYRSSQEVGWFSSARLIVNYFLLLPTIFLQAIFPLFSKLHVASQDNLREAYTLSFKYLLWLGFFLCAGTLAAADPVILLVFGPGFEQSAVVLRILSFVLFWMFGYANGSLLLATGGQNLATKLASISMVLMITASLLLIPTYGVIGASVAHILPGAVFFIPVSWICHRRLGINLPYALTLKTLFAALFMGGMVTLFLRLHLHVLVAILIVAPCAYLIALAATGAIGRRDWELVKQLFKKRFGKD